MKVEIEFEDMKTLSPQKLNDLKNKTVCCMVPCKCRLSCRADLDLPSSYIGFVVE
jgi:hypothetical protein